MRMGSVGYFFRGGQTERFIIKKSRGEYRIKVCSFAPENQKPRFIKAKLCQKFENVTVCVKNLWGQCL